MSELSDYLTAAAIMGYRPSEELVRIARDLERQLAEAKAEIEEMRPMVERYRWLRSNDRTLSISGIWIDEARKHP